MSRTFGEMYAVWKYIDENGQPFYQAEPHQPMTELEPWQLAMIVKDLMTKEDAEALAGTLNQKETETPKLKIFDPKEPRRS